MSARKTILFSGALIVFSITLRLTTFSHPIWSIDEGVTFTIAQQLVDGDVLYRDAVDHRTPLVPYLKAIVFLIAGDWNTYAVHLVVALLLGWSAILVWRTARKLGDPSTGVWAAWMHPIIGILLVGVGDTFSANTGWFLIFFSSLGFHAFADSVQRPSAGRGLLTGLWFGLAAMCKQPALLDFGVTWVILGLVAIRQAMIRRDLGLVWLSSLIGAALPLAFIACYYALRGVYDDFIFYAFTYNTEIYVPAVPAIERWKQMQVPFVNGWHNMPILTTLAIIGGAGLLFQVVRDWWQHPVAKPLPLLPWLILGWTASGIVSTGLSGRSFAHYATQVVPGMSLAVGWLLASIHRQTADRKLGRRVFRVLCFAGAVWTSINLIPLYRTASTWHSSEEDFSKIIAKHTSIEDRIFVWGYFPEYYVFSKRLPATRFSYTNFLTGLIPWTNIDAMIDTSDQEVEGSWDKFYSDFSAKPPAFIVYPNQSRGQSKYPIAARSQLWSEVTSHYAMVALDELPTNLHMFRRLDNSLVGVESFSTGVVDPKIHIQLVDTLRANGLPQLAVTTPAGVSRVDLVANNRVIVSLPHPIDAAVSVRFFLPKELPVGIETRVVIHDAKGIRESAALDLASLMTTAGATRPLLPLLHIGDVALRPLVMESYRSDAPISRHVEDSIQLAVPARVVYRCPPEVRHIDFIHGLSPSVTTLSDGYDVTLRWLPDGGGAPISLWEQRVLSREEGYFQLTQEESVDLPARGPGRLEFRFLSGKVGNLDNDNIFFGRLRGTLHGPLLFLNDEIYPSLGDPDRDSKPLEPNGPQQWLAHVPTMVRWNRPPDLDVLEFEFGVHDGAFESDEPGRYTDGVDFIVELIAANGEVTALYQRFLNPLREVKDRGRQTARVSVPRGLDGQLRLRTAPGPNNDASWDWAWIGQFKAHPPAPPLVMPDGTGLRPTHVSGYNDGWAQSFGVEQWSAHPPQELTYPKSSDLTKLTFTFGISDGAAIDASGHQRSDGISAVVLFKALDGTTTELFRRRLDPYHNEQDYGPHTATLELPSDEMGELIFCTESGPNGSNSFDWAYWGAFVGHHDQ